MNRLDGVRILVVDDEPFMRKTIKQMLRVLGAAEMHEAGDGAAALEETTCFKPDIVLCDIGMTPVSGLAFIERLRAHADAERRQTPVVMLTAHKEEGTVNDAVRLGIDGYLVKPVSSSQLAERLSIVLQKGARA